MALVVETGGGSPTAVSYVTVSYVDAYHAARGHSAWMTATITNKEYAIVRATDHIERIYGHRFRGVQTTQEQALSWPRYNAQSNSGLYYDPVPKLLMKASAEYAVRALNYGILTPDPPPPGPRQTLAADEVLIDHEEIHGIRIKNKELIGPLESEVTVAPGTTGTLPMYPAADRYMTELIKNNANRIIRG